MTWGVPLLVSYHFAFSYCSWGFQGKNTEVACHSLLQWTTFCQASPPWPAHLGWPHKAWLSVIELDKAVVHVIRLASFLWLWFRCVCPLMPSCNTYRLTGHPSWHWTWSSWPCSIVCPTDNASYSILFSRNLHHCSTLPLCQLLR